ncbi:hypothetical protein BTJ_5074 [Burkholderia thailandensis E444]|nr:hypothetical protein BTJ_5074 [Burkholderia thailandensis E444]
MRAREHRAHREQPGDERAARRRARRELALRAAPGRIGAGRRRPQRREQPEIARPRAVRRPDAQRGLAERHRHEIEHQERRAIRIERVGRRFGRHARRAPRARRALRVDRQQQIAVAPVGDANLCVVARADPVLAGVERDFRAGVQAGQDSQQLHRSFLILASCGSSASIGSIANGAPFRSRRIVHPCSQNSSMRHRGSPAARIRRRVCEAARMPRALAFTIAAAARARCRRAASRRSRARARAARSSTAVPR